LKCKNKHTLIRKFNLTSNEKKNYHHPTFIQYKKSVINVFHLYRMKKNLKRQKIKLKISGSPAGPKIGGCG
jgi:hypothetical protein